MEMGRFFFFLYFLVVLSVGNEEKQCTVITANETSLGIILSLHNITSRSAFLIFLKRNIHKKMNHCFLIQNSFNALNNHV